MKQLGIIISFMLFIPSLFAATTPRLKTNIPEVYIVKKGDNLWNISGVFLENPWSWPELWQANSYIKNPHLIYPGDRLHLIWVDGKPKLSLKKHMKLSPKVRVVRDPITTLPGYLMLEYVAQNKLISPESAKEQPQVLGASDERGYLSIGDTVWADQPLAPSTQWRAYRVAETFKRDDKEKTSAVKAKIITLKEIADLTVMAADEKTSQLRVDSYRQEISPNDILLPILVSGQTNLSFSPSTPPESLSATVIGQLEGRKYMSNFDVVVLDRGHLDGMHSGHVFDLFKQGANVQGQKGSYHYKDNPLAGSTQLGQISVGKLMVLRPYESFSLAIIIQSLEPFTSGVIALSPER
jgi:hypothetical protein